MCVCVQRLTVSAYPPALLFLTHSPHHTQPTGQHLGYHLGHSFWSQVQDFLCPSENKYILKTLKIRAKFYYITNSKQATFLNRKEFNITGSASIYLSESLPGLCLKTIHKAPPSPQAIVYCLETIWQTTACRQIWSAAGYCTVLELRRFFSILKRLYKYPQSILNFASWASQTEILTIWPLTRSLPTSALIERDK